MLRYELQERGLLKKEEVQVVPDVYIKLVTSVDFCGRRFLLISQN